MIKTLFSNIIISLALLFFLSPTNSPAGQANLAWDPPDISTDVTGYLIHHGTASGTYSQDIDVGNTTSYTVSNLIDGQTYYFAVTAYNDVGYQSVYSNEVSIMMSNGLEEVTLPLRSGWNLISLDCEPIVQSITNLTSPIVSNIESIWAYENGAWQVYDPLRPEASDLSSIVNGKGYWINSNARVNLSINGQKFTNRNIELKSGWNLVGYNGSNLEAVADALATIAGKYFSVWTYKAGDVSPWKVYDPENPGASGLTIMEPGYGYWIHAKETCTWTLP